MCGLPVATYGLAGIPEIVIHDRTGLVAPPGDISALTDCALRLVEDSKARTTMGSAARTWCEERFEMNAVASRYFDTYAEVVGS
jgi:glycosyltransferase involved in cell wall biosynthesis